MFTSTFFRNNVQLATKIGGAIIDTTIKAADKIYTPIHQKLTTLKPEETLWQD